MHQHQRKFVKQSPDKTKLNKQIFAQLYKVHLLSLLYEVFTVKLYLQHASRPLLLEALKERPYQMIDIE